MIISLSALLLLVAIGLTLFFVLRGSDQVTKGVFTDVYERIDNKKCCQLSNGGNTLTFTIPLDFSHTADALELMNVLEELEFKTSDLIRLRSLTSISEEGIKIHSDKYVCKLSYDTGQGAIIAVLNKR